MLLGYLKYDVQQAYNGEQALQLLIDGDFDLVMLDGLLPDMTGEDICRQFRAWGHETPVLMVSGQSNKDDQSTAMAAGANDYLVKPFSLDDLSKRVKSMLSTLAQ